MDPNPRKNDPHLPDALAQEVLSKYPAPARGRLEALGNRGGFSGACLWRVHTLAGPFCLRAAAPAESRDHVITRHRWMTTARKAGASFVPTIVPTSWNDTVVSVGGRFWEFMSWLPGRADFREAPSPARLRAAAQAVARLHRAWEPLGGAVVPLCPAVARRLEAVACWKGQKSPESDPLIGRIESAVTRWLPRVPGMLAGWLGPWRVQPCLRDIWHDHLLYEGEQLTGLIDYAGCGMDSVATDLARMFGSLVEDDEASWQLGLYAYREVRELTEMECQLARVLDRTGMIVALTNWHGWRIESGRSFTTSAAERVTTLLNRVERWRFEPWA